jgi:hypothetical protein
MLYIIIKQDNQFYHLLYKCHNLLLISFLYTNIILIQISLALFTLQVHGKSNPNHKLFNDSILGTKDLS